MLQHVSCSIQEEGLCYLVEQFEYPDHPVGAVSIKGDDRKAQL